MPTLAGVDIWWQDGRASVTRFILSKYLGVGPAEVKISIGQHGKPILSDERRIDFNISHSAGMAVCAVSATGAVGVDIEKTEPIEDYRELLDRILSRDERLSLERSGRVYSIELFYRTWVFKEALVKAIGVGLSYPVWRITLPEGGEGGLVRVPDHGSWWVRLVDAPAGYMAACALQDDFVSHMRFLELDRFV